MNSSRSIVFPIILSVLVSAIIFGLLGYYLGNIKSAAVSTTVSPTTSPSATVVNDFITFKSSEYQFDYPKTAQLIDTIDGIFVSNGITYSVEKNSAAGYATIDSWIKDVNASHIDIDLAKYTKVTVSGKDAYTYKGEARTYTMNGNVVLTIIARNGVAPIKSTTDTTYVRMLSSFKLL